MKQTALRPRRLLQVAELTRFLRWRRVFLVAAGLSAATPQAFAQSGPASDVATTDEIVVTGTRVRRSGSAAPTPLSQINADEVQATGEVSLLSVLTDQPAVGTSLGAGNSTTLPNASGLEAVNLRNLGLERTLVLVNGKRFVPFPISTNQQVAVDLSNIPTSYIQRVETVTGGSSAVYGSEAIAGVINIITKENFSGLQLDAQGGVAQRGDSETFQISALGGADFRDGRGHITVIGEFSTVGEILVSDREAGPLTATGGPTGFPVLPETQFLLSPQAVGALAFERGPDGAILFDANGAPIRRPAFLTAAVGVSSTGTPIASPFNAFSPASGGVASIGGAIAPFNPFTQIFGQIPTDKFVLSGNVKYEIAKGVEAFLEGSYSDVETTRQIIAAPSGFATVPNLLPIAPTGASGANPFIPPLIQQAIDAQAALAAVLNSDADPANNIPDVPATLGVRRLTVEAGPQIGEIDRETLRFVAGFKGETSLFQRDWSWEAFGGFGQAESVNLAFGSLNNTAFDTALSPALCAADPSCPGVIDLFADSSDGVGATISADQVAFIAPVLVRSTVYEQITAGFEFSGEAFELPAGRLGLAGGIEYRAESLIDIPDPLVQPGGDVTTLNETPVSQGEVDVYEIFGEISAPILADLPGVQSFDVTAAGRFSHFSTSGGNVSWKVGGVWQVVPDLRFRASFDRAFRSPNLAELFTGPIDVFTTGLIDPCDDDMGLLANPVVAANCSGGGPLGAPEGFDQGAVVPQAVTTQGNPDLLQEEAETIVAGAVIQPRFAPGLTLTVDYYDIEISQAINQLSAQQTLITCFSSVDLSAPACSQLEPRGATGLLGDIVAGQVNSGLVETSGFDFEVNYGFNLADLPGLGGGGDFGKLSIRWIGNYLREFNFQTAPDGPITVAEGAITAFDDPINPQAFPRFSWSLRTGYDYGRFSTSWQVRSIGAVTADTLTVDPVTAAPVDPLLTAAAGPGIEIGSQIYIDALMRYRFSDRFAARIGVNNLFDNDLPFLAPAGRSSGGSSNSNRGVYDFRGRYFFAGVNIDF